MRSVIKRPRIVERLGKVPVLGKPVLAAHNAWVRHKYHRPVKPENAEPIRLFRARPPVLDAVQQRVLDDFQRRGIAHVHFNELIGDQGLWRALAACAENWLQTPEVRQQEERYRQAGHANGKGKDYIIFHYGESASVSWDSPWLQLGLHPRLLDLANSYLGLLARMYNVDVWNTIARPTSGPLIGSQNWHRDGQCARLVKMFLYFTDVDLDSGALEYVPYSRPGEKYGDLWPQRLPHGSQPPAEEFKRRIPPSEWTACSHPAGTFVFVDTAGFHRGGRATKRNRVFATWAYCGHESAWFRSFALDASSVPATVNPAARHALLASA